MFGYVITNCKALDDAQRLRFRSMYCGLCHVLKDRFGDTGRLTLSYDMTFLALLLSALYEPEETAGREVCLPHPFKPHDFLITPCMEYAADLNVALAYHKCRDNWTDDRNPAFYAGQKALAPAYRAVCRRLPEKCRAIERWMDEVRKIELSGREEIDPPTNLTGEMLGELFDYRADHWSAGLRRMGSALGRFIYLMDAYDDLKKDVRHKKYNPLKSIMGQPDFEPLVHESLTMMMADCAEEFEQLPVIRDADLIRNILYSGVWAKYGYIQQEKQKAESKGAK